MLFKEFQTSEYHEDFHSVEILWSRVWDGGDYYEAEIFLDSSRLVISKNDEEVLLNKEFGDIYQVFEYLGRINDFTMEPVRSRLQELQDKFDRFLSCFPNSKNTIIECDDIKKLQDELNF